MDHISMLLVGQKRVIDTAVTPKKIHACIAPHIPQTAMFSVSYRSGTIQVKGSNILKSEFFLKKEKILAALKKEFPHIHNIKMI